MGLSNEQRQRIVDEALSWVKTPYRGNTCLKSIGCDCGQFLFGVYSSLGFIPADAELPKNYSLQAAVHKDDPTYRDTIRRFAREITEKEVQPGDMVLYRFGRGFSHGSIVVKWPEHIIHSLTREGVHSGHGMNLRHARREKEFYTLRDEFCGGVT